MRMDTGAQVPTSVTKKELLAAMKPLLDLLGINDRDIYADQPVVIAPNSVTFVMAAGEAVVNGRRVAVPAPWHPQGDHDPATGHHRRPEYAHMVSVRVYGHDEEEPPHWRSLPDGGVSE